MTDTRGQLTGHVQPGSIGILAMCEPWMESSHSLCATRHAKIISKGCHFNDAPPFDRLKRLEGVKRLSAIQKSYNFPLTPTSIYERNHRYTMVYPIFPGGSHLTSYFFHSQWPGKDRFRRPDLPSLHPPVLASGFKATQATQKSGANPLHPEN